MQNKKLGQKIQGKMQESEYNSFLIMEKDKFDFLNNKPIGTNSTADDQDKDKVDSAEKPTKRKINRINDSIVDDEDIE